VVEDGWHVVVNNDEQYSVWPDERPDPPGWQSVGTRGTREECLDWIAGAWPDIRPATLRAWLAEHTR
jgi:MbtH protein